jgi:hypothetical protein
MKQKQFDAQHSVEKQNEPSFFNVFCLLGSCEFLSLSNQRDVKELR